MNAANSSVNSLGHKRLISKMSGGERIRGPKRAAYEVHVGDLPSFQHMENGDTPLKLERHTIVWAHDQARCLVAEG